MMKAAVLLALLVQGGTALAQGSATSANRAADIKASDIQAAIAQAIAKDPQRPPDTPMRTVDGGGAHVVGVVVTHRLKGTSAGGAVGGTHEKVTEVYHVLEGSGTLVTDGTLVNPRRNENGQYGPGLGGTALEGAVSRRIAKGDTVIIPPGVPHRLADVQEDITILILTVDPERVITLR